MSPSKIVAIAVGAAALTALPLISANAQDEPLEAERACVRQGVTPNTAAFDVCVGRTLSALRRGNPVAAEQQAAIVRNANNLCRSYGIAPATLGYRECVNREVERRATVQPVRYTPMAPRILYVDAHGFQHDDAGNIYAPDGSPIRPVP